MLPTNITPAWFKGKFCVYDRNLAAAPPVAPEIVTDPFPTPMLTPPAPENTNALLYVPEDVAPVVFPAADTEMVEKLVTLGVVAEIENVPFPTPTLTIPMPDMARTLFIVPDEVAPVVLPEADSEIVENAAPAIGADMLTVPFPAPTLTAPIPENASTLLNVPDDVAPVVLPDAERDTVEKFVTEGVVAEIVILPAPAPTLTIPAPDMLSKLENVPDVLPVVFPNAVMDMDEV